MAERIPDARRKEIPELVDGFIWADARADEIGLREIELFLTGLGARLEPDRVLATVLFTDIVGSTRKAAELGDAAWRDLLVEHHALVRGLLARYRGVEIDTAGDGFFASFDGPGAQSPAHVRFVIRSGRSSSRFARECTRASAS